MGQVGRWQDEDVLELELHRAMEQLVHGPGRRGRRRRPSWRRTPYASTRSTRRRHSDASCRPLLTRVVGLLDLRRVEDNRGGVHLFNQAKRAGVRGGPLRVPLTTLHTSTHHQKL